MTFATAGASVRRSSVPDPLAIFGSSKLLSWMRADNVTITSGRVSDFGDGSGNGRTYTQGTSGNRPVASTALGFDTVLFDGAASEHLTLSGTSYGSPSALSVIRIMKRNADPAPTSQKSGLDDFGNSLAKSHVPFTDGTIYDHTGCAARATVGNPAGSLAVLCMYESIATASKFDARLDGTVIYTGAALGMSVHSTPTIGGGSHGAYMDGHIAEVLVLNAEQTAGERTALAAYVLARYGLTVV